MSRYEVFGNRIVTTGIRGTRPTKLEARGGDLEFVSYFLLKKTNTENYFKAH
jgi:hypothetical protein